MNVETMYCHNPGCELFNEEQNFAYRPTTWEAPSEWVEDPECRDCYSGCETEPLETEELVDGFMDELSQLSPTLNPNEIYTLIHRFAKEAGNNS